MNMRMTATAGATCTGCAHSTQSTIESITPTMTVLQCGQRNEACGEMSGTPLSVAAMLSTTRARGPVTSLASTTGTNKKTPAIVWTRRQTTASPNSVEKFCVTMLDVAFRYAPPGLRYSSSNGS
eukprot:Amastigsp_a176506_4.p4 type:complete len:124 gc:universal Amastigsp_a176506_4:851-480(-)